MLRSTTTLAVICLAHGLAACSNSDFASSGLQQRAAEARSNRTDAPLSTSTDTTLNEEISLEVGQTLPTDSMPTGLLPTDRGEIVRSETSDPGIVAVNPATGAMTGVKVGSAVVTYTYSDGSIVKVLATVTPPKATTGSPTSTESGTDTGTDTNTNPDTGTNPTGGTGTNTDGLTPEDKDIVDNTPGVQAIRAGVNFEDQGTRGDKDFNDAVLCFEGIFKVDGSNVVSIRNQEVVGVTSSLSGCNHTVRVEIVDSNGLLQSSFQFDSKSTNPVVMKFDVGSRLEVYMTAAANAAGCDPGVKKSMHNPIDAIVAANVCRTTGH